MKNFRNMKEWFGHFSRAPWRVGFRGILLGIIGVILLDMQIFFFYFDHVMNEYQTEQLEALQLVRDFLGRSSRSERAEMHRMIAAYQAFREETAQFLRDEFGALCTRRCYASGASACCAKDSIIVFFADVVVNALNAPGDRLNGMAKALSAPNRTGKCVFLGPEGCRWTVKPIVCEMFLCDAATDAVFSDRPEAAEKWALLEARRKTFTWPDRPVLFDDLERRFLDSGIRSTLMHLNFSPGMLRLKRRWSATEPAQI
jgi:hypothetical protein